MNCFFILAVFALTLAASPLSSVSAEQTVPTTTADTTTTTTTVIATHPITATTTTTIPEVNDIPEDSKSNFAISLHPFSTMGVGANIHAGLSDYVALKVGYHTLPYTLSDYDYEDDDGNIFIADADISLNNIFAGFDVFPFKETFKLTLGYVAMNSEISGSATPEDNTVTIDGITYNTATEIDSINAIVTFPSSGIYAGFGWGNPTRDNQGWGFSTEFGVILMTESPEIDVTPNCKPNALTCHTLETSLEEDEAIAQEDLDSFTFYPVVNIGVSYQF